MAEWVSHLIVADRVLEQLPHLKRHEFCVGNIAPGCIIVRRTAVLRFPAPVS